VHSFPAVFSKQLMIAHAVHSLYEKAVRLGSGVLAAQVLTLAIVINWLVLRVTAAGYKVDGCAHFPGPRRLNHCQNVGPNGLAKRVLLTGQCLLEKPHPTAPVSGLTGFALLQLIKRIEIRFCYTK
jgi:hypothetical protein